jgi:hypothetical protein
MSKSSTKARVKDLLSQDATTKWRRSAGGTDAGNGSDTLSRDEVKRIVKEGVAEALEGHEHNYHQDETESETDTSDESRSSGRRVSKKKLLLIGAVVAYLARRRRSGSESRSIE